MISTTEMTTTRGRDQFYPTPPSIAGKMLAGLDLRLIQSVLEPSAGKGNLIGAIARMNTDAGYSSHKLDIDFCEIDPYLRQICRYNFSDEKRDEFADQYRPLDHMLYSSRTPEQTAEMNRLRREMKVIDMLDVHCVNDDFLTYRTYKRYEIGRAHV